MKYETKSNTEQTSKHTAARSKAAKVANHSSDAVAQRKLANAVSNSPQMVTQREVAGAIHQSPQLTALRESSNAVPVQREADSGAATNTTGLPDGLKSGIESMSGISMDNVNVHYNSNKPAQLQALAHTQGTDIHVAPGQEKHLPHEAWHVVQQAQGRVKATMQMKGVGVNDDAGLEHEADVMGAKAASFSAQSQTAPETRDVAHGAAAPVQRVPERELETLMEVMKNHREEFNDYVNLAGGHSSLIKDMLTTGASDIKLIDGKDPAFWTGPGSREAAEARNDVFTLGRVATGQAAAHVANAIKFGRADSIEYVWNPASQAFATAVGKAYGKNQKDTKYPNKVYAFVSKASRPDSVWVEKEKPILESYGVNIEIIMVDVPVASAAAP